MNMVGMLLIPSQLLKSKGEINMEINIDIHELIRALLLHNLHANGVLPILDISHREYDLNSNSFLHIFTGEVLVSGSNLLEILSSSWFDTHKLTEAILRDFEKYEPAKNLQVSAELNDSQVVISYYITMSI